MFSEGVGVKQKVLTMLTSVISYIHFRDCFLIYIDIHSFNQNEGGGGDRLLSTVTTGHWVQVLGTGADTGELIAVVT